MGNQPRVVRGPRVLNSLRCVRCLTGVVTARRNVPAMGLHTDRRNHEGIPDGYVQGLVNLIPTSPASGGNVIIPRSHKYVDDLDDVRSLMKDGQSFYECARTMLVPVLRKSSLLHVIWTCRHQFAEQGCRGAPPGGF